MSGNLFPNVPDDIAGLGTLALDLRWSWTPGAAVLWRAVDSAVWERTRNPVVLLKDASRDRLAALAADRNFRDALEALLAERRRSHDRVGWFHSVEGASELHGVAYFSLEFGVCPSLPIYAGGLGVLAGDILKTSSDLDIPVIGIGLLYKEGYFRQFINMKGEQEETSAVDEADTLPIEPALLPDGTPLRIGVELPGRTVTLKVWRATVGSVPLYLLDSDDPDNRPIDRCVTTKLYDTGNLGEDHVQTRLLQEILLGVGGWRLVQAMHPSIDVLHLNEGHCAWAIIARACHLAGRGHLDFRQALWATRAGTVFTTHTPVAAAFDSFPRDMVRRYVEPSLMAYGAKIDMNDVLELGADPKDPQGTFNMAFLAARGSLMTLAVSRLHEEETRRLFQKALGPYRPYCDMPVSHVTNAVHVPTWLSELAKRVWTRAGGESIWEYPPTNMTPAPTGLDFSDAELWAMRCVSRRRLVDFVRAALRRQTDAPPEDIANILDPDILTIGFARRFTEYKRPGLLLSDRARFERLLLNGTTPIQLVIAGKAHPSDEEGKRLLKQWVEVSRDPRYRTRVVFLADYDMATAQQLVAGVDLWINCPRRPMESSGTSGMKCLANGVLNCSSIDGWWAEARDDSSVGWSFGSEEGGLATIIDKFDAASLYRTLEEEIVPHFYERDEFGVPSKWIARVRESMTRLAPTFAGARMMRDYVQHAYLPLARALRARLQDDFAEAKDLEHWSEALRANWHAVQVGDAVGNLRSGASGAMWDMSVPVILGNIDPDWIQVELYADPPGEGAPAEIIVLHRGPAIDGPAKGYHYGGSIRMSRPAEHYTVRVVPHHRGAVVPIEQPLIAWQK
jgi:starch phosphorylase